MTIRIRPRIFPVIISQPSANLICGNKMPTRCNRWLLLQILLLAQHVSGTTMPIIRSWRVLYKWLLPVVFGALVFKLSVCCGAEGYVSETCSASNKMCNKNNLLHLVGILFPHINDDAQSKSRQPSANLSGTLIRTTQLHLKEKNFFFKSGVHIFSKHLADSSKL